MAPAVHTKFLPPRQLHLQLGPARVPRCQLLVAGQAAASSMPQLGDECEEGLLELQALRESERLPPVK